MLEVTSDHNKVDRRMRTMYYESECLLSSNKKFKKCNRSNGSHLLNREIENLERS